MEAMSEKVFMLDNGLSVAVADVSRHYYGGYWQVAIELSTAVPVTEELFDSSSSWQDARRVLGDSVCFVRRLDKMAVPASDMERVRDELLQRMKMNMLPLLSSDRFATCFVATEYRQRLKKNIRGIPCLI